MTNPPFSLRLRLSILFFVITLIPILILTILMPMSYKQSLDRETQLLTDNTLDALAHNIETYLDELERQTIIPYSNEDIMQALKLKAFISPNSNDAYYQLRAERALTSTFSIFLQNSRKEILGVTLITDNNAQIFSLFNESKLVQDFDYIAQEWYQQTIIADGKAVFIGTHLQDYVDISPKRHVFSVARLIKDPDTRHPLAVIIADADTNALDQILGKIEFSVWSFVGILDENNSILYSNQPLSGEIEKQIIDAVTSNAQNSVYIIYSRTLPPAPWRLIVLLSKEEIMAKTRSLYLTGVFFAIGDLLLSVLLFFVLSRWIITPFSDMMKVMKKVEQGDLTSRFVVQGSDEIALLGKALNYMIAHLDELVEREYVAVIKQQKAEYHALQSQIQPHFLYNTLNGFIGLNRLGDMQNLEKGIMALSGMLRYIFIQQEQVKLEDEFSFLQKYCDLQLIRFQDRLKVVMYLAPEVKDVMIPRLLIQPLVENAIIHGIEPLSHSCELNIIAKHEVENGQNKAHILIQDNGQGFDPAEANSSEHLGIKNVLDRLKLVYPQADLSISSAVGLGTKVSIRISF